MQLFGILWKIPLLFSLLLLGGCDDSWSWHQKLTVTVETPSGLKSASSVMKASLEHRKGGPFIPREATGAFFKLEGEAVVLEVVPGKYLFALLKDMPRPYGLFFPGEAPVDIAPKLERMSKPATATLIKSVYPLLVTFTDINNPKTVKRVDPDNLAEFFGSGTSLTSITLSITREQVTEGKVEDVLGWLKEEGEKDPTLLPNPPYLRKDATDPDMQYLTVSSFSTELYKCISQELMLVILSPDACNRRDNRRALELGLVRLGSKVGTATVGLQSDAGSVAPVLDAGFATVACGLSTRTSISCLATDSSACFKSCQPSKRAI